MKNLFYLFMVIALTGCDSCDTAKEDPKPDKKIGNFTYLATSKYFDSEKKEIITYKDQAGVLSYSYSGGEIIVFPNSGGQYTIEFSAKESNGNGDEMFNIHVQSEKVNEKEFSITGITKLIATSKDGNKRLVSGLYKKSINNLTLHFKSIAPDESYVENTISASPR